VPADATADTTLSSEAGRDAAADVTGKPDAAIVDSAPSDGDARAACDAGILGDDKNCAACGNDCFGGECRQGRCYPDLILALDAESPGLVEDLSLDGDRLYWMAYVNVAPPGVRYNQPKLGVSLTDGGRTTVLTNLGDPDDGLFSRLRSEGSKLFWTSELPVRIESCTKPDCADNLATPAAIRGTRGEVGHTP
jgi:hypothetical protein